MALEYRPDNMKAPVVVAKGRNLVAQRIKHFALWHDVPIVENRPLAQALYKTVEVGESIPAEPLYGGRRNSRVHLSRAGSRRRRRQSSARRRKGTTMTTACSLQRASAARELPGVRALTGSCRLAS